MTFSNLHSHGPADRPNLPLQGAHTCFSGVPKTANTQQMNTISRRWGFTGNVAFVSTNTIVVWPARGVNPDNLHSPHSHRGSGGCPHSSGWRMYPAITLPEENWSIFRWIATKPPTNLMRHFDNQKWNPTLASDVSSGQVAERSAPRITHWVFSSQDYMWKLFCEHPTMSKSIWGS